MFCNNATTTTKSPAALNAVGFAPFSSADLSRLATKPAGQCPPTPLQEQIMSFPLKNTDVGSANTTPYSTGSLTAEEKTPMQEMEAKMNAMKAQMQAMEAQLDAAMKLTGITSLPLTLLGTLGAGVPRKKHAKKQSPPAPAAEPITSLPPTLLGTLDAIVPISAAKPPAAAAKPPVAAAAKPPVAAAAKPAFVPKFSAAPTTAAPTTAAPITAAPTTAAPTTAAPTTAAPITAAPTTAAPMLTGVAAANAAAQAAKEKAKVAAKAAKDTAAFAATLAATKDATVIAKKADGSASVTTLSEVVAANIEKVNALTHAEAKAEQAKDASQKAARAAQRAEKAVLAAQNAAKAKDEAEKATVIAKAKAEAEAKAMELNDPATKQAIFLATTSDVADLQNQLKQAQANLKLAEFPDMGACSKSVAEAAKITFKQIHDEAVNKIGEITAKLAQAEEILFANAPTVAPTVAPAVVTADEPIKGSAAAKPKQVVAAKPPTAEQIAQAKEAKRMASLDKVAKAAKADKEAKEAYAAIAAKSAKAAVERKDAQVLAAPEAVKLRADYVAKKEREAKAKEEREAKAKKEREARKLKAKQLLEEAEKLRCPEVLAYMLAVKAENLAKVAAIAVAADKVSADTGKKKAVCPTSAEWTVEEATPSVLAIIARANAEKTKLTAKTYTYSAEKAAESLHADADSRATNAKGWGKKAEEAEKAAVKAEAAAAAEIEKPTPTAEAVAALKVAEASALDTKAKSAVLYSKQAAEAAILAFSNSVPTSHTSTSTSTSRVWQEYMQEMIAVEKEMQEQLEQLGATLGIAKQVSVSPEYTNLKQRLSQQKMVSDDARLIYISNGIPSILALYLDARVLENIVHDASKATYDNNAIIRSMPSKLKQAESVLEQAKLALRNMEANLMMLGKSLGKDAETVDHTMDKRTNTNSSVMRNISAATHAITSLKEQESQSKADSAQLFAQLRQATTVHKAKMEEIEKSVHVNTIEELFAKELAAKAKHAHDKFARGEYTHAEVEAMPGTEGMSHEQQDAAQTLKYFIDETMRKARLARRNPNPSSSHAQFAQKINALFKTKKCRFWYSNVMCPYGESCNYAHYGEQLPQPSKHMYYRKLLRLMIEDRRFDVKLMFEKVVQNLEQNKEVLEMMHSRDCTFTGKNDHTLGLLFTDMKMKESSACDGEPCKTTYNSMGFVFQLWLKARDFYETNPGFFAHSHKFLVEQSPKHNVFNLHALGAPEHDTLLSVEFTKLIWATGAFFNGVYGSPSICTDQKGSENKEHCRAVTGLFSDFHIRPHPKVAELCNAPMCKKGVNCNKYHHTLSYAIGSISGDTDMDTYSPEERLQTKALVESKESDYLEFAYLSNSLALLLEEQKGRSSIDRVISELKTSKGALHKSMKEIFESHKHNADVKTIFQRYECARGYFDNCKALSQQLVQLRQEIAMIQTTESHDVTKLNELISAEYILAADLNAEVAKRNGYKNIKTGYDKGEAVYENILASVLLDKSYEDVMAKGNVEKAAAEESCKTKQSIFDESIRKLTTHRPWFQTTAETHTLYTHINSSTDHTLMTRCENESVDLDTTLNSMAGKSSSIRDILDTIDEALGLLVQQKSTVDIFEWLDDHTGSELTGAEDPVSILTLMDTHYTHNLSDYRREMSDKEKKLASLKLRIDMYKRHSFAYKVLAHYNQLNENRVVFSSDDMQLVAEAFNYATSYMVCHDIELQILNMKMTAGGVYPGKCLVEDFGYEPLGTRLFTFVATPGHTGDISSTELFPNLKEYSIAKSADAPATSDKTSYSDVAQSYPSMSHAYLFSAHQSSAPRSMPEVDKITEDDVDYYIAGYNLGPAVIRLFESRLHRPLSDETRVLAEKYNTLSLNAHKAASGDRTISVTLGEVNDAKAAFESGLWKDKMNFSKKLNLFLKAPASNIGKDNWDFALKTLAIFKKGQFHWDVKGMSKCILDKHALVVAHAIEMQNTLGSQVAAISAAATATINLASVDSHSQELLAALAEDVAAKKAIDDAEAAAMAAAVAAATSATTAITDRTPVPSPTEQTPKREMAMLGVTDLDGFKHATKTAFKPRSTTAKPNSTRTFLRSKLDFSDSEED
jgi:hypothetical protein